MAFAGPFNRIGPQGPKGKDGCDGIDGKDGKNGRNGKDGKDGKDGITKVLYSGNFSSGSESQSTGSFQKYFISIDETYTIPQNYSSVITGPMVIEGIVVLEGRLEVI